MTDVCVKRLDFGSVCAEASKNPAFMRKTKVGNARKKAKKRTTKLISGQTLLPFEWCEHILHLTRDWYSAATVQ